MQTNWLVDPIIGSKFKLVSHGKNAERTNEQKRLVPASVGI